MLLSVQELRLLRLLKAVQRTEDNFVRLDFDSQIAKTANSPNKERSVAPFSPHLVSILRDLEKQGCVRFMAPNTCRPVQVTHAGWHLFQFSVFEFLRFLGRSVLVPIIVSIITTIITVRFFR